MTGSNDLSEKMKRLVDKVVQLSSDQVVDSGCSSTNGKRKRTKDSLRIQVRLSLLIFGVANNVEFSS